MAALLLALVAGMTPFVVEPDRVQAQASPDSTLSILALSVGELAPAFNAGIYDYDTKVSNRTSSIRVTAAANILGSQVRIYTDDSTLSPGDDTSITPAPGGPTLSGNTVSIPVGTTFIGIEVTALDTTTSVYQVEIERISSGASSDATLSAFSFGNDGNDNAITLSPPDPVDGFDKDVTSYTALVTTNTMNVTVTATATDTVGADVDVSSDKDSTIADDNVVDLSVGVNVITAKVTAANLETEKTYTLRVTRAAANASDDARLRSLSLRGITLSPTFDPDEDMYTANVPYRITQTTVAHAVNQSGARATVTVPDDFNPLAGGHQVFLGVGANTITIAVTAEDADATGTYTVTVNRAAAGASGNADLTGLTIGTGTLSPGFNKDVASYTALVPTGTTTIDVVATAHADAAPPVVTSNKGSGKVPVNSTLDNNVATHTVTLDLGANVITAKVTAANFETTKTYTLTVTRAAANASDDAMLRALMVGGESVSVSGFTSDTGANAADYTTGVANGVNSIAISATPNHSGATVAIETGGQVGTDTGWVVDADGTVGLSVGANNILIEVTAENGSTSNYFLVITRASALASDDATLSAFSLVGTITVSPGFDKDVTSYTALVPTDTTSVTVTATATDSTSNPPPTVDVTSDKDSTIANDNVVELSVGVNVITAKVTAANFETTKTYTLTVTKAAANASDDAKLSALMVGGESVSVSGFTSDTGANAADYTTGVANGVSSIAISATPNHSGAMVTIQTGGDAAPPYCYCY